MFWNQETAWNIFVYILYDHATKSGIHNIAHPQMHRKSESLSTGTLWVHAQKSWKSSALDQGPENSGDTNWYLKHLTEFSTSSPSGGIEGNQFHVATRNIFNFLHPAEPSRQQGQLFPPGWTIIFPGSDHLKAIEKPHKKKNHQMPVVVDSTFGNGTWFYTHVCRTTFESVYDD